MSAKPSDRQQTDLSGSLKEQQQQEQQQPIVPAELESVNLRLGRLRDEVLPSSPYLLTVPTDVPFRLGNRFVNNWAVGKKGPFAAEEQQLQYMTFLMHHDADSLLVAVGDWSDNDGRIMAKHDEAKPQATPTTPATLSSATVKKKISLSDYKTRAKGEPNKEQSRASQEPSQDDTRKESNERQHAPLSHTTKERASQDKNNERSSAVSSNVKRPLKDSVKRNTDAPAPKRIRLTPPRSRDESLPSKRDNKDIPALLSPTLPPTSSIPQLPELLSPTLPPGIEEELAHLEDDITISSTKNHKSDNSAVLKTEASNTRPPVHAKIPTESKPSANKTYPKDDSMSSSLATSGRNDRKTQKTDLRSASPYEAEKSPSLSAVAKPIGISSTKDSASANKLIVKLRYGRSNRKLVGALLKFGGKRTLADSIPSRASKESFSGDEDDDHLRSESKSRGRKREHSPADDRMEEYPRDTFSAGKTVPSDKARSSNTISFKSPSEKRPAVSKTDTHTPVKEGRAKHQRSVDIGDAEVKTPMGSSGKAPATIVDKNIKMSPTNGDSQSVSSREKERRAWREEFQKYAGLGRELKHIADRYSRAKATSEQISMTDGKLAAASAIESILCFILAFIANDRCKSLARQVGDSETWRSIIAYWRVVERTTSVYPHLHGLCLVLGAVSRDTINSLDLERLAVCSLPGEQSPVPTPGSDGNTVVNADKSKSQNKKEFSELRTRLPENHKEATRLWLDGCQKLSDDVLIKDYPETWAKRSRNYMERGHDNFRLGQYGGDYFLPFGRTTTPMETVRFGVALLREWCKKENIEFKARLKL